MKTPLIIPAYNEASRIGKLLEALPSDLVDPIVAINGPDDGTARIAASYGARVLETGVQGKLPAIQYALKQLGEEALSPLLMLDADTSPLRPRQWHKRMVRTLGRNEGTPTVLTGPLLFTPIGHDPLSPIVRSMFAVSQTVIKKNARIEATAIGGAQYGANLGLHIQSQKALDEVLGLDHYWPREDRALARAVVRHKGRFIQSLHPDLIALTPESPSYPPLIDVFKHGASLGRVIDEAYSLRGAPGSRPYDEFASELAQDPEDSEA